MYSSTMKHLHLRKSNILYIFLFIAYTIQIPESMSPSVATEAYVKALAFCHGPLDHYDFLIKNHEIKDDAHQRRVIQCLQKLHEDLKGYSIEAEGIFSKVRFV